MLAYKILTAKNGKPPTANAAFNYLLSGDYQNHRKGDEFDLALLVKERDDRRKEVTLNDGYVLTQRQLKRTFKNLFGSDIK